MKPWSKLQKELYNLISPDINFQIHCVAYPMHSQYGSASLPRYWITLGKEIIWDYPKDFVRADGSIGNYSGESTKSYPYKSDVPNISELIREYIDTPKEQLFDKHFENDFWGLVNILKAADRRIGTRRLDALRRKVGNKAAIRIIEERLKTSKDG